MSSVTKDAIFIVHLDIRLISVAVIFEGNYYQKGIFWHVLFVTFFPKSQKTYQNFTHHKFWRDEKKDIFALWYCIPFANMTAYLNQITLVAKDWKYFKGHKGFCIHSSMYVQFEIKSINFKIYIYHFTLFYEISNE